MLVTDGQQVRLYDFFDHKDEKPEIVTVLESQLKIDIIKVNKNAEEAGERKDIFYYVIACKEEFKVYTGRLEILFEGNIDDNEDSITCIEFGLEMKYLYIGSEKGFIRKYELPSPQEVQEEYEKGPDGGTPHAKIIGDPVLIENSRTANFSIEFLYRISGILEYDLFALHVAEKGLRLLKWTENHDDDGEDPPSVPIMIPEYSGVIDCLKATIDGQFLLVGLGNKIQFYRIEKNEMTLSILEGGNFNFIYDRLETDDNLTMLLVWIEESMKLDFYTIKWTEQYIHMLKNINIEARRYILTTHPSEHFDMNLSYSY